MESTKSKKKESQYNLNTNLKSPLFKIVLVGDSEVGKTSIIQTFINKSFPKQKTKKSVGINFSLKEIQLKNLNWDTAGNEKLRTMIGSYYRGAHGIIIVFDHNNIKSFYSVKNWLREIKQFANEDAIKYLVCNKYDLRNSTIQFNKHFNLNNNEIGLFEGLSDTNKTFNNHSLILPSNLNTITNNDNLTLNNIILTNPNQTTNNINKINLNSNFNNNTNNNNLNSVVVSSKNSIVPLTDEEIEKFAKQNSMKFYKISASLNQGITELFEDITHDIIYKMNDEDLINRSRSIKLGYNNVSMYYNEEQFGKDWNYLNSEEKKAFLKNRNGNANCKDSNFKGEKSNNNKDCLLAENNDNNNYYFNSNITGCCKII